jgi:outer membrane protein TolC
VTPLAVPALGQQGPVRRYGQAPSLLLPSPTTIPRSLARGSNIFKVGTVDLDMIQPGQMKLSMPSAKELIPIANQSNPIQLEASFMEPITLKEALDTVLRDNLPIRISQEHVEAAKWRYISALGKFLPDIENSYQDQQQRGNLSINGALALHLNNPYVFTRSGLRFFLYRGGSVLSGAMQRKHFMLAAKSEHHATVSDALLEVTKRYYALVLSEVLLEIRTKETVASSAQLLQNEELKGRGLLTNLEVLQSKTQLARSRQSTIAQQIARRNSAIRLASYMNVPNGLNFYLIDKYLSKTSLIDQQWTINDLLAMAFEHRPELKLYDQQRLAARRAVMVAVAPLLPTVSLFGNVIGSGATLSPSYTNFSPTFAPVAVSGPATTANVLGNTGIPLPPVIGAAPMAKTGIQQVLPAAVVPIGAQTVSRQINSLFTAGFNVEWNFQGLGVVDAGEIQAARAEAREASLRSNDELIRVTEEVRTSYVNNLNADAQVDETTAEVASAQEELLFAQERFVNGVGTNVDVIVAQKDYTQSLVNKAQAIVEYNLSQVQLLRDIGMISVNNICTGTLLVKPVKR